MNIKRIRIVILLVFISALIINIFMLYIPKLNIETAEQFELHLDENIDYYLECTNTPGVAVALIESGEIKFINEYGYSDIANNLKIVDNSIFQMASISKPLTAWGVMNLVEEGKVNLDKPISEYISRWQIPESEFDENEVTVRKLLSHTAGLSLSGYFGFDTEEELQSIEESLSNPKDAQEPVHLAVEPGTRYMYSGGGITLLQLMIEEVSGVSFATYMTENIIKPLGLNNTTFAPISKESFIKTYDENLIEQSPLCFTAEAAAGLSSTPQDMADWVLTTMDIAKGINKSSILSQETIKSMMEEVPLKNDKLVLEKLSGGFGLGYCIEPVFFTDEIIYMHIGHNQPGWKNLIAIDQNFNTGIVVMTNGANGDLVYARVLDIFTDYVAGGTSLTSLINIRLAEAVKPLVFTTILFTILLALTLMPSIKQRFN